MQGVRPDVPRDTHPELKELMQRCWDFDPRNRLSFSQIRLQLEGLLLEIQVNQIWPWWILVGKWSTLPNPNHIITFILQHNIHVVVVVVVVVFVKRDKLSRVTLLIIGWFLIHRMKPKHQMALAPRHKTFEWVATNLYICGGLIRSIVFTIPPAYKL